MNPGGLINISTLCRQTAIKKMKKKFYSWDECIQLREVKVQQQRPTVCMLVHSWSLLIVGQINFVLIELEETQPPEHSEVEGGECKSSSL